MTISNDCVAGVYMTSPFGVAIDGARIDPGLREVLMHRIITRHARILRAINLAPLAKRLNSHGMP
jgi:hypothetical protein